MSIKKFESALKEAFLSGLTSFAQFNYQPMGLEELKDEGSLSDRKALQRDWEKVGEYLNWGINEYKKQYANSK